MPRTLLRAPGHDRNRSLGWLAIAWMEYFVRHGPGPVQGQKILHGDEYTGFVVDAYALGEHPSNNHMLYDSAFLSRPKGCDKSGLGGRLGLFEAFGPCRFLDWAEGGEVYEDPWGLGFTYTYEAGEPMGQEVTAPYIRCMATEENQVGNVFDTIYYNLTNEKCPLYYVPGVDANATQIFLPEGGEITASTTKSASKDGGKETMVIFDESHLYTTRELRRMYETVTRNLRKRKLVDGTWYLETTTMFATDEDSVAKATFAEAQALREGSKRRGRWRLLYDHRWGECKRLSDEKALRAALREAYGDAMQWMDEDGLVDEFYDTRKSPQDSRRYFLNAQTSAYNAWIAPHYWEACKRPAKCLVPGDTVTLGLDGSVDDDATALVAVRLDGHIELLECWEKPEGPAGEGWQVDREAVDAKVAEAMTRFRVVGFFADPAHWQDYLDRWNNEFGHLMLVKASDRRPLEWWTNRPRQMVAALQRFYEAVREERVSYTPADDRVGRQAELALVLTRHLTNARESPSRSGLQIRKEYPKSPKKIDAVMAAVLAYEAACEAIAAGVASLAEKNYVPKRVR